MKRKYEMMLILNLSVNFEETKKKIYEMLKEKYQGEIIFEDDFGIKELGYPIKDENKGHYFLLELILPTHVINDLHYDCKLMEDEILREMIIRVDEKKIQRKMDAKKKREEQLRKREERIKKEEEEKEKEKAMMVYENVGDASSFHNDNVSDSENENFVKGVE